LVVDYPPLEEQAVEIVGRAADYDGEFSPGADLGDYPCGLLLELCHDPGVLAELDAAEEVVRDAPLLWDCELVGYDRQALVQLHRVGVYYLAVVSCRELDGELGAVSDGRRQEDSGAQWREKMGRDVHPTCRSRSSRR
jgi:hypothetical protein